MADETYTVHVHAGVRRSLADLRPEPVAVACFEFIRGPLSSNPRRVGTPLRGELEGYHAARVGSYRMIYAVDEERRRVQVIRVAHRANVYRRT